MIDIQVGVADHIGQQKCLHLLQSAVVLPFLRQVANSVQAVGVRPRLHGLLGIVPYQPDAVTVTLFAAQLIRDFEEQCTGGSAVIGANVRSISQWIVCIVVAGNYDDAVKFPGTRDGVIVIASHYDTNYPLRNTSYIGANDGASSSALLLEIANQLRGKKRDGYSIWLVWDDAEEAMKAWSDADSLYGIRHLAQKWQDDGTLKKMKAFLLADMIGDADLNIDHDQNSTPWLEEVVYQAATRLGYQSHFFARENQVSDDHLPFMQRGVPCADLIDFDYGYDNVFWHTPQDTVDKLSPKSLEIIGSTILETVNILDRMDPLPPK